MIPSTTLFCVFTKGAQKRDTRISKTEGDSVHEVSIKMTKVFRKGAQHSAKQKVIPSTALFRVFTKGAQKRDTNFSKTEGDSVHEVTIKRTKGD